MLSLFLAEQCQNDNNSYSSYATENGKTITTIATFHYATTMMFWFLRFVFFLRWLWCFMHERFMLNHYWFCLCLLNLFMCGYWLPVFHTLMESVLMHPVRPFTAKTALAIWTLYHTFT